MGVSALGGLIALFSGAVIAGIMYQESQIQMQDKIERLTHLSENTLGRLKLEIDNMERTNKEGRRNLCMACFLMVKETSERVAGRLIARYFRNFPNDEHMESAIREANEVVAEELVKCNNEIKEKANKF